MTPQERDAAEFQELFPDEPAWTDASVQTMMGEIRFLRALLASILLQLGTVDNGLVRIVGDQMFRRSKVQ